METRHELNWHPFLAPIAKCMMMLFIDLISLTQEIFIIC